MNDQSIKLIEQLAQKLGTTTEYLWLILVNQASVVATITLFQTLCVVLFGLALWKIHVRLSKNNENSETGYEKYAELTIIPMFIGAMAFVILSIACFCCIGDIVNGYFNPEYWALREVMNIYKQ